MAVVQWNMLLGNFCWRSAGWILEGQERNHIRLPWVPAISCSLLFLISFWFSPTLELSRPTPFLTRMKNLRFWDKITCTGLHSDELTEAGLEPKSFNTLWTQLHTPRTWLGSVTTTHWGTQEGTSMSGNRSTDLSPSSGPCSGLWTGCSPSQLWSRSPCKRTDWDSHPWMRAFVEFQESSREIPAHGAKNV